ncbi:MAG TPA: zinc ribbon domain-containing protein, partial [Aggregicoccus sp.]|nr:zinc ribbon domain-containing protein [Aggregicoccus sp.]
MSACPCCLEALKTPFLGLGGRQLAGACEVCGDAVCERCLHTTLVDARAVAGAPGPRRVRARACASCVYALAAARGEPPPFAEPPGSRRRAAQAACAHARRAHGMGFCPDCGAAAAREAADEDPVCDACGAPSHARFNCCFACGASFGEENEPGEGAEGYLLEYDCAARDCGGQVAAHMAHCPWCGRAQPWPRAEDDADCTRCEAVVDATWAFCAACGEEAPLPEHCASCADSLVRAACAARCEECRRMVCGECFDDFTLPDAAERGELLL